MCFSGDFILNKVNQAEHFDIKRIKVHNVWQYFDFRNHHVNADVLNCNDSILMASRLGSDAAFLCKQDKEVSGLPVVFRAGSVPRSE